MPSIYEIFYIIIIITYFFVPLNILLKINKTKKRIFLLAVSVFFVINGILRIFYYIWNFINPDNIFWIIGATLGVAGTIPLIFAVEKEIIHMTKYAYTILAISMFILFLLPFPLETHIWIQTIMYAFLGPLVFLYFWVLVKRSSGEVRNLAILLLLAVFIYLAGNAGMGQIFIRVETIRFIIAPFLLISANFIFLYVFAKQVIELSWPTKIHYFFLFYSEKGINIYAHSFTGKISIDGELIAGSISGITGILQEITKSERRLKLIDQDDIKIILEYGTYITGALITEENFKNLRKKVQSVVKLFELQYGDQLKQFIGVVDEFEGIQNLVEDIFSTKDIFESEILK
ncbi:MAG: hypothetical protein ACFFDN_22075 [Candidatus Hodarchaeota archaeon]